MITGLRNQMVRGTPHVREIGPHDHIWKEVGKDVFGETYEICPACNARRCRGSRNDAALQDWLNTGIEWQAGENPPVEEPVSVPPQAPSAAVPADDDDAFNRDEPDVRPTERRGPGRPRKYV